MPIYLFHLSVITQSSIYNLHSVFTMHITPSTLHIVSGHYVRRLLLLLEFWEFEITINFPMSRCLVVFLWRTYKNMNASYRVLNLPNDMNSRRFQSCLITYRVKYIGRQWKPPEKSSLIDLSDPFIFSIGTQLVSFWVGGWLYLKIGDQFLQTSTLHVKKSSAFDRQKLYSRVTAYI